MSSFETGSIKASTVFARLPKLTLKTFSGDILKFNEFWQSYELSIHYNNTLDAVTKFNYLRNLLEGDAASSISGLSLTGVNYNEAINILHSRYGNKQVLISSHIDKLLSLPSVNSSNDLQDLRKLYGEIETNVRSLKNLDIKQHRFPISVDP